MKQKSKIIMTMTLTSILSFSTIAPNLSYATTRNTQTSYKEIANSLDEILNNDGVSKKDWNNYIDFVKDGTYQDSNEKGVASGVKKALKFIVKHLDVIPSKTLRDVIKKYGGKVIDVIDTIDTWTWYGIASVLTAAGIPDSAADMIADFIVNWLL